MQNPRGGGALSRVTVTAYAFDDKGSFLASGRAPIDVAALAPGDESPFVVSIPVTETVARYRIGFRGEDGTRHRPRRQTAAGSRRRPTARRRAAELVMPGPGSPMMKRVPSTLVALLMAAVGPAVGAGAGQPPPPQSDPQAFKFRTGVELINVNATVTDQSRPLRVRA